MVLKQEVWGREPSLKDGRPRVQVCVTVKPEAWALTLCSMLSVCFAGENVVGWSNMWDCNESLGVFNEQAWAVAITYSLLIWRFFIVFVALFSWVSGIIEVNICCIPHILEYQKHNFANRFYFMGCAGRLCVKGETSCIYIS